MTTIPVSCVQGINVYNLSSGKTLPEWLEEAQKKKISLRYNEDYRSRIELIQDLSFPISSKKIKFSKDGQYIIASGIYPPQIKIFETNQLSLKCERHVDAEILQFQILSNDYSKLVLLRSDRTFELHTKFGFWEKFRLPKPAFDFCHFFPTSDLFSAGYSSEIYRFNLDQGRFLSPISTQFEYINTCGLSPTDPILAFGGNNGLLACYDPRSPKLYSQITAPQISRSKPPDISSLRFSNDGLSFLMGLDSGHWCVYDLRSSVPIKIIDHRYGLPIHTLKYHHEKKKIFSVDNNIIKIWDQDTFEPYCSIQPSSSVNSLTIIEGSGLIFAGSGQHRVHTFYIPSLGLAPGWCSFLDSLIEEMSETNEVVNSIYDDYKFLTKEDINKFQIDHLIGTNLLKPYMHGFFIDMRLYKKIYSISQPFSYEKYVKEQIQKKIEEKAKNRITPLKKLPKINKKLAEKILSKKDKHHGDPNQKIDKSLLNDDRFSKVFNDKLFTIDEESFEYKRLHPSKNPSHPTNESSNLDEIIEEGSPPISSSDYESDYDLYHVVKEQKKQKKKEKEKKKTAIISLDQNKKNFKQNKMYSSLDGISSLQINAPFNSLPNNNATFTERLNEMTKKIQERKNLNLPTKDTINLKKKSRGFREINVHLNKKPFQKRTFSHSNKKKKKY